uniref:Uncharacterized protein n=1 Tax=Chromera velia CCMP2878 TaxID=1169474 RepID=A0A0G4HR76_9ALVE|eukprot:Cvel_30492.t1-p1 / transcript=Cvel_30492.t1 / gene=Cvel_30492 / organism=Chromera_velia_CCMP2878 / gene_product=hypothetical protein / transcript_product=hypothetical protein / location=Cvel_scaffold4357:3572-4030(+) / protein_length=153 / sequence_SO=supercontig / SO=protein_coding / is_pseudo=false
MRLMVQAGAYDCLYLMIFSIVLITVGGVLVMMGFLTGGEETNWAFVGAGLALFFIGAFLATWNESRWKKKRNGATVGGVTMVAAQPQNVTMTVQGPGKETPTHMQPSSYGGGDYDHVTPTQPQVPPQQPPQAQPPSYFSNQDSPAPNGPVTAV